MNYTCSEEALIVNAKAKCFKQKRVWSNLKFKKKIITFVLKVNKYTAIAN